MQAPFDPTTAHPWKIQLAVVSLILPLLIFWFVRTAHDQALFWLFSIFYMLDGLYFCWQGVRQQNLYALHFGYGGLLTVLYWFVQPGVPTSLWLIPLLPLSTWLLTTLTARHMIQ